MLVNLLAVLALLSVAMVAMWLSARRAVQVLSGTVIAQALDRAELELHAFFDPVERHLVTLGEWAQAGIARPEDPRGAELMMAGPLRRHAWMRSMIVADESGQLFVLASDDGSWIADSALTAPEGPVFRREVWTDAQPTRRQTEPSGLDPRTRPWYRTAIESGQTLIWTEPFTTVDGEAGITAATAWEADGDKGVVGITVTLLQISRFTTSLRLLDGGVVFVLTEDGRMVGLPRNPARSGGTESITSALLARPQELDMRAPQEVFELLLVSGAPRDDPHRLKTDDGALWAQIRTFELAAGRNLIIGVAVPEEDLLGELHRWRTWVVLLVLVLVAGAVWRAVRMARRYSLPLESLVAESGRIATGDLEPGEAISSGIAEVHELTAAHDKMRNGLKTLLKLEDDLRIARTIQQNTLPDELPELPGYELEAWNEPADETGGDSYDLIGLRSASSAEKVVLTDGAAERALLLLADATGHGIGPALSVTQVRAMLRMAARLAGDLATVAREMNEQLFADLPQERFITAWLGLLDSGAHTLTSFSAGQAPLLHFVAESGECRVLGSDSVPLGMFSGIPIKLPPPIRLHAGDIFAVISDGIFEASGNSSDEEFGVERTVALLERHHRSSAAEILARIREAVAGFTALSPADDDRTIILVKRSSAT